MQTVAAACRDADRADGLLGDLVRVGANTARISSTCWRRAGLGRAAARAPRREAAGRRRSVARDAPDVDRRRRSSALDRRRATSPSASLATTIFLALRLEAPAAARRRARRRQDRGRASARRVRADARADPPPVLRRASTWRRPSTTGTTRGRCCTSALLRSVAEPRHRAHRAGSSSAPRSCGGGRCCARSKREGAVAPVLPHRRDRSRRRGVRGVPARAARRLADHDPRDRHDPRDAAAGRRSSRRTARARCTTR